MENERLKQGDKITLTMTGTGADGEGVGRCGGCVVFVPYAVPGDEIAARVVFAKKNYAAAALLEILKPSPDRIEPVCNRFGRCGGCAFLDLDYAAELREKRKNLADTLKKLAGYDGEIAEIVPSEPLGYRNKLSVPFGVTDGKVSLGFYRPGTHKVVSTGKCFLNGDWAETLIAVCKAWANERRLSVYTDENKKGLLRHVVARRLGGKLQVTIVLNGEKIPFQNDLAARLNAAFPDVSLYLSVNREDTNVVFGKTATPVRAHPQTVSVSGIEAELHPFSFFQVNDAVREKLYRRVRELASAGAPDAERVFADAYAGVGILGASLAKSGFRVCNLEIVPEATRDADALAVKNGVADRVENRTGDSAVLLPELLPRLAKRYPNAGLTVALDPPRKGCDRRVLDALLSAAETVPLRVLYISCNPATLARDLKILSDRFSIASVEPFDMFPRTPHLETLVSLNRKDAFGKNGAEIKP